MGDTGISRVQLFHTCNLDPDPGLRFTKSILYKNKANVVLCLTKHDSGQENRPKQKSSTHSNLRFEKKVLWIHSRGRVEKQEIVTFFQALANGNVKTHLKS